MEKIKKGLLWFLNSYIWLFIICLATDIITKNIVVSNMNYGQKVDLIPGFLAITYSINDKAAFSIGFPDPIWNKIIYTTIAVIATFVIVYYLVKKYKKTNAIVRASLMLVLVGAIGNVIDRLFYSPEFLHSGSDLCGVVDWIDFYGIWGAIFNIADSCVVIAAGIFLVYFIIDEVKEQKEKAAKEEKKNTPIKSKTELEMENSKKSEEVK